MFTITFPVKNYFLRFIFIAFLALPLTGELLAKQISSQARSQISQQAALLATEPVKVVARVPSQELSLGAKSQVQITLLNADDVPVPAKEAWQCEVSIRSPSGNSAAQNVWIKKGESTALFDFSADQPGLTSIYVRPLVEGVRPGKTMVIVRPARKSGLTKSKPQRVSRLSLPRNAPVVPPWGVDTPGVQFLPARFELRPAVPSFEQTPSNPTQPSRKAPILHISVDNIGGTYRANGKDSAIISAVFDSPDLSPAPTNIRIWLRFTNGALDPPQPLQITKGSFKTEAHLTSAWPANVHVKFENSTPEYQAEGDTDFDVLFIPPGVALVGPTRLSLVANEPVMVVFFDSQQQPVSPVKSWQVTLRSKKSRLHFTPQSFEVQPPSPIGSAILFPVSFGSDTIDALVTGYSPQPLPIVITGWLVLILCLVGSVAGGLAAYDKFKGSLLSRIFLGILGGAILCWLYVYLGLPKLDINIAHNTYSVFFVALIGGYMGTTALDFAAKKFGLT